MNRLWLSYKVPNNTYKKGLVLIVFLFSVLFAASLQTMAQTVNNDKAEQAYGPENLLKTWSTPFATSNVSEDEDNSSSSSAIALTPIGISSGGRNGTRNLLEERFHGPKLFLPARMVLGQSSEFTIKGSPGSYVAVAMADSNKGAKTIYGHKLRLGADRKLVAVGKIPEQGILSVFIEAPIQGDLIGLPLYFEAVVWTKPDFSDLQLASTVSVAEDSNSENGVIVCGQEEKKERAVVFDVSKPMSMHSVGLSSGRP